MKNVLNFLAILVVLTLAITSCKKEKTEEEDNDNEMITTVRVQLTEEGTSNVLTFNWKDIDGQGGEAPVIDDIVLKANTVYTASLVFLDESKTPAENITEEIEEEGDVHRIYYNTPTGLTVGNLDTDENGLPLGINSTWTTTNAATGTLQIILRHYGSGGKEASDPANSSKSSPDADVSFSLIIE